MTTTMDTVSALYEAFGQKDFGKLRGLLSDDFNVKGHLMACEDPDVHFSTSS